MGSTLRTVPTMASSGPPLHLQVRSSAGSPWREMDRSDVVPQLLRSTRRLAPGPKGTATVYAVGVGEVDRGEENRQHRGTCGTA